MATVINLRTAKKQAARKAARQTGDEKAAKFGRSKAEKSLEEARAAKVERDLAGHKLDKD